ncbi:hypothetical protein [Kitasatospora terrestris]|uniref:Uncharacterized protein n=1 Tax=Kitasatospora terrestris TaxID=258051 RepID=A0ABP9DKH5_9ACTN
MTVRRSPRAALREALLAIGAYPGRPAGAVLAGVAAGLSDFAPDTAPPAVVERLGLSVEEHPWGSDLGLCLGDGARLTEVLWLAGECQVPAPVRERWPDLAQEEWESALLIAKLVLRSLESSAVRRGRVTADPAWSRFRAALVAIGDGPGEPPEVLAAAVADGLLAFGSETPDNLAAAGRLGVSAWPGRGGRVVGLCVLPSGTGLSRLLEGAVGGAVPEQLRQDLPELVQEDWDTVLAVSALALAALEGEAGPAAG